MTKEKDRVEKMQNRDGKIFNFRPVTICVLFIALGILLSYAVIAYGLSLAFFLLLIPLACLLCFLSLPFRKVLVWLLILLAMSAMGGTCFYTAVSVFSQKSVYDGECTVSASVAEKHIGINAYTLLLEDLSIDGTPENAKMIAYLPATLGENIRLADKIVLVGTVKTETGLTDEFGVRGEEIAKGVAYTLFEVQSLQVVGEAFEPFLWIRQRVYDVLESGMGKEAAAFCKGMLLGDDEGMDKTLLQNARYGGIAHIFAVSGLHIGVLFSVCAFLTGRKFFKSKPKILSFVATALILVFYGGICGFSTSVIRAILTCLTVYAYRLLGIKRDGVEGVSLAALIILLLFPSTLFEVGFLLSFFACYGIILLSRPIKELLAVAVDKVSCFVREKIGKQPPKLPVNIDIFQGDTPPKSIGERAKGRILSFLSVTLSAWLAVTPISIAFFGYASVWGLLLNCLFVPLLSLFFVLLLALTGLACILPFAAGVLLYVPASILSPVIFFFEVVPIGGATLAFSPYATTCYYAALLALTDKFAIRKRHRCLTALLLFALSVACLLLAIFT